MKPAEVIDLLTLAAAYDRRTVGQADVEAWRDAANRGRWTYDEAREALQEHYATSTGFLMPGHITERINRGRRPIGQPPKYEGLTPAERELEKLNRGRVVGLIGGSFAMPRETAEGRTNHDDEGRTAARAELDAIRSRVDHQPLPRQEPA